MEAYSAVKELKTSVRKDRVTVDQELPRFVKVSIMKPEESLYCPSTFHYNVWVEINTHGKIMKEWIFKTLEEAESKWKEVSGAIERGEYEILLRVDGGDIQIRFPTLQIVEHVISKEKKRVEKVKGP